MLHGLTPFEVLMKSKPNYDSLRVSGSPCYVLNKGSDKFASRAKKCVMIGYPYGQKAYKVHDLDTHQFFFINRCNF